MGEDYRKCQRHKVRFKMIYDDGESFNAGLVHDLSESGLFLETAMLLPVGAEVDLTTLDIEEDLSLDLKGEVIRVVEPNTKRTQQDPGMAFVFRDMTPEKLQQLRSFISRIEQEIESFEGTPDLFFGKSIPRHGLHRTPSGLWRDLSQT